jgi:lipid A 3-O-deacylase
MNNFGRSTALVDNQGVVPELSTGFFAALVEERLASDERDAVLQLALVCEFYVSGWHAEVAPGQRADFVQVGVVPMWRWRFDAGKSPWFVDAGVGVSYQIHDYVTRTKRFGSRLNFSDHLGAGRSFGDKRAHELSAFLKHVSNGGLSSPTRARPSTSCAMAARSDRNG